MAKTRTERGRQGGHALLVVVLAATAAGLAGMLDRFDATAERARRTRETGATLQLAKTALLGYAVAYRDVHPTENFGHLPCPDAAGQGVEQTPCGKSGAVAIGLLPYKTLGLPELRDADGNLLWYAVSGSFKTNPKSFPFNWDTQGQLTVRSAEGSVLAAPDDSTGGAAAVVIAPGPALSGQRRTSSSASDAGNYVERDNAAFVDGVISDGNGMPVANDRVVPIGSREIFDAVVKRADFASFMSEGIAAVRSKLGTQRNTAGNALPANPFGRQTSSYSFYEGWKDQFRYVRCAKAGCYLDGAGDRHNAVLLFGGRARSGAPRPSSQRSPADYFEAALAWIQGSTSEPCAAEAALFDNSSAVARAADMVLCLAP
ncbi:MAG: hypothetical protein ACM3Y9_16050 [Ignavibacteria bacterium]